VPRVGIELVPEAGAAEQEAVSRALASAAPGAKETSSPWWREGLVAALGRAPSVPPRPSAYDAVRSPRSTRGATRA
jgi:hypothetical protein